MKSMSNLPSRDALRSVVSTVSTIAAAAVIATLSSGCVSAEYRAYEQAEGDYEQCLSENTAAPESCHILEDAVRRRYEEYERAARQRSRDYDD